ncbi:hypothetical protein [Nocardia nova]|uniref:hypothetical protein n=1 Tax=Nocardia nova TaxID=37330 RepID=UPI001CA4A5B9|nr:hypothetical protein [Nocardia nova]
MSSAGFPGAVTATGAVAALVYGFISAAAHGRGDVTTMRAVATMLMGCGIGLAFSPLNVIAMANEAAGAAGGAPQTLRQTGAALGWRYWSRYSAPRSGPHPARPYMCWSPASRPPSPLAVLTLLVASTFPRVRARR